jgi:cytochrome c oxidase subunit 1
MLCVIGFVAVFMIGGLSGVMIASVPFDTQVHDTYFIVAHLHYVLMGAVFPLFGGIYYWFPKITGRLLSERLGLAHVALFFAGINITFFPMHFLGLDGMPRRVYTYLTETGWGTLNLVATIGAFTIAASVIVFLVNVFVSLARGEKAGDNPWGAESLEWATASPPPSYGFLHIPIVEGRAPLWDRSPARPVVTGLRTDVREQLVTTIADAIPEARHGTPTPTVWPLLAALATGVFFITLIFTPWGFVIGVAALVPALVAWAWPSKEDHDIQISQETQVAA